MYSLKGFALISSTVDNTEGVIAPVGELSPLAKTYAKEKTIYRAAGATAVTLMVFTSTEDGEYVQPDGVFVQDVLTPLNWVYTEALSGSFTASISGFEALFLNRWGSTIQLNGTGAMIQSGSYWFPEYIDFSFRGDQENVVRIWYNNTAFMSQYDDFEIVVMLPLEPLDQFFDDYTNVSTKVSNISLTQTLDKFAQLREDYPETMFANREFFWVDANNRNLTVSVDWPVLIYGAAGNNIDTIKEAIVNAILANSNRSRDEWAVIFPDIFTATEYILVPMWRNFAIPNMVLGTGTHSPVVDMVDAVEDIKKVIKGADYTEDYIETAGQVVPTAYRGLSLVAVGSPNNRSGITKFNQQFVDYVAVSTTHPDFARISLVTQRFIVQLIEMLRAAETLTPVNSVPQGMTRLLRDGVLYVSKSYLNIQYNVVTQYSMNDVSLGFDNLLIGGAGISLVNDAGTPLVNN